MSFVGDAAMAVSTRVALLGLLASFVGELAVVISVAGVTGCVAVYTLVFEAISSVSSAAVVTALGGNIVRVAVVAFRVVVLDAVNTAFMAVMFVFMLDALSRHFFFWPRLPCPGPGMLSVKTK